MESKTALVRIGQISGQLGILPQKARQVMKIVERHNLPAESHLEIVAMAEEHSTSLATIDQALLMGFSLPEVDVVLEVREYLRRDDYTTKVWDKKKKDWKKDPTDSDRVLTFRRRGTTLSVADIERLIVAFPPLKAESAESLGETIHDMLAAYDAEGMFMKTAVDRIIEVADINGIQDPVDAAEFCRACRRKRGQHVEDGDE